MQLSSDIWGHHQGSLMDWLLPHLQLIMAGWWRSLHVKWVCMLSHCSCVQLWAILWTACSNVQNKTHLPEHEWPRKHSTVKVRKQTSSNQHGKSGNLWTAFKALKTIMVQWSVEQDYHLPRLGIQGDDNTLDSISSFSDHITRVSSIRTQLSSTPL